MKKIYLVIVLALTGWACEEKDNLAPVGNWELSAPDLVETDNISLNETSPEDVVEFEWQPAVATNRFVVTYTVSLYDGDDTEPLITLTPGNGGKELSASLTASQLDYILWTACYQAGATANMRWVVTARSIDKIQESSSNVSVTRFTTEYVPSTLFITGEATEAGADVTNATPMRARLDASKNQTHVFDVYTTLTEGTTYHFRDKAESLSRMIGGTDGTLSCGASITAPETGIYRVTVNLNDNTYSLWKVDRWSLVGDAVEGGWGGDVPLDYKGRGVWESEIEFYQPYEGAGFIFRANGDWGYIIKRIDGTATPDNKGGRVFMESEAGDAGITIQDVPGTIGLHTVTLDLSANGYTYKLTPKATEGPVETIIGKSNNLAADAVSGKFEFGVYDAPTTLFLLSGGDVVAEFTKDGNVFRSEKYIALQASKSYTLNAASDGSGENYNIHGDGTITVDHDQAYQINVDFATGELSWKHYNMKLFHWNDDGGWDARQELVMTYIHPYKYEVTGTLTAGFDSKFNSPWEVQFGTDATALTGTMTNGGDNFKGITSSGTYKATIVVSDDYETADYTFVKQ